MRLSKSSPCMSRAGLMTLLIAGMVAGITSVLSGIPPVNAATNQATATVELKATFTAPPCTLTTPSSVFLGSILPGEKSYRPFSVEIACPLDTPTALYAEVVAGSLTSGSTTRVSMTGPANTGTPAHLWLTADGDEVKLDGSGKDSDASRFCSGDTNRSCSLTPYTLVDATSPRGETTATLRFSVAYP